MSDGSSYSWCDPDEETDSSYNTGLSGASSKETSPQAPSLISQLADEAETSAMPAILTTDPVFPTKRRTSQHPQFLSTLNAKNEVSGLVGGSGSQTVLTIDPVFPTKRRTNQQPKTPSTISTESQVSGFIRTGGNQTSFNIDPVFTTKRATNPPNLSYIKKSN